MVKTMPIRLAQARLIPWDSATPDHRTGIRTLLATGYAPDGEHRPPHQKRDAETSTVSRSNLTYSRSYPKAPTCVNRIGMETLMHHCLNNFYQKA